MTVHTICDRCGMEYTWEGVSVGGSIYCCLGCASGGPCTCAARDPVLLTDRPVLVDDDTVVIVD